MGLVMGLMNLMNLLIIFKFRRMKTIEERAMEYAPEPLNDHYAIPAFIASENKRQAYIAGATEQKAIDDAELLKLKSAWGKEAQINHDAIEKACNIFCYTGCPHKTDSYNCFNNKCDTWKIFRRIMEE